MLESRTVEILHAPCVIDSCMIIVPIASHPLFVFFTLIIRAAKKGKTISGEAVIEDRVEQKKVMEIVHKMK